jgi:type I restriction enzyme S subunit
LYRKSDGPCAFAGYTIRFKPDPQRLLPEFLLQFTHSQLYYQWVKGMLRAGAQPNINGSEYSRLYLPIPPLDEQKKITEILSTVDDAIEKTSAVIEKSNQLKKGLMQTLLTRGIGHTKFKKSPAGEIPVDWEVVKLGDVAVQPEERFVPVPGDARPYIGLEHIGSGTGRLLSTGTSTTVSSLKSIFRAGDILFGKLRPNLKKVVMPSFDGVCSTDIMVIRPKDGLSRSFMFYRLQSATAFDFAVGTSGGTKMPRTSWPLFRNYAFPCPHLAEQKKIAEILSGLDAKIEQEEAALMETQKLKHGLMRALLTGRVRVTK